MGNADRIDDVGSCHFAQIDGRAVDLARLNEPRHRDLRKVVAHNVRIIEVDKLDRGPVAPGLLILVQITQLDERIREALGGAFVQSGNFGDLRQT